jgi:hypothetical protein
MIPCRYYTTCATSGEIFLPGGMVSIRAYIGGRRWARASPSSRSPVPLRAGRPRIQDGNLQVAGVVEGGTTDAEGDAPPALREQGVTDEAGHVVESSASEGLTGPETARAEGCDLLRGGPALLRGGGKVLAVGLIADFHKR